MKRKLIAVSLCAALCAGTALADIKIAYIDPLSGPMANVGNVGVEHFTMAMDKINEKGGVLGEKLVLVPFDNKLSPQESLIQLKGVIDQGIRYVTQGNGSSVAGVLIDAIGKHNARNPDKSIVFLNYAAIDPDFTNKKCSFWHFRFDANGDMKMQALTNYMETDKSIKKVYIIGQDYSHGHQVSRAAKEMLAKKRPDIQIVGDDLHPIGRVKDFAPYVSKIKAAGADAVITGNWGNDMALLGKAAKDAGLQARFFTYYGGGLNTPRTLGDALDNRIVQVTEYHPNIVGSKTEAYANEFKARFKEEFFYLRINNTVNMFAEAATKAKSTDPLKVALALEDMRFPSDTGELFMRKSDHQVIQPLFISTFHKKDGKAVKYDVEDSGYGPKTNAIVPAI